MRRSSFLVAISGLALAALPAPADDTPREAGSFEPRRKELAKSVAWQELELAKKLEKAGFVREAWDELALALEIEPDDAGVRERLGYKKDGSSWKGHPTPPPKSSKDLDDKLAKEVVHQHEDGARRFASLAKQAKAASADDDARRLAGFALDLDPREKTAREVLGHRATDGGWIDDREARIAAAFKKAFETAGAGTSAEKSDEDTAVAVFLGFDVFRENALHASFYVGQASMTMQVAKLCKTADVTWASYRYYTAFDDEAFSVEGEPKVTGPPGPRAPDAPARILILDDVRHARFSERAYSEEARRDIAKKSLGTIASLAISPGKSLVVYETRYPPERRPEFVAAEVIHWMARSGVPESARVPDFLLEGLQRFFSGHATGRADITHESVGFTSKREKREEESFDGFRASVRRGFRHHFEGDLRSLFARKRNDLTLEDDLRAYAFVDFCFARHRVELSAFLSSLKEGEAPEKTFEGVFKKDLDALEPELREFVREEY